jgi:hypothetical protein
MMVSYNDELFLILSKANLGSVNESTSKPLCSKPFFIVRALSGSSSTVNIFISVLIHIIVIVT